VGNAAPLALSLVADADQVRPSRPKYSFRTHYVHERWYERKSFSYSALSLHRISPQAELS